MWARAARCRHLRWQKLAAEAQFLDTAAGRRWIANSQYELAHAACWARAARAARCASRCMAPARMLRLQGVARGQRIARWTSPLLVDHVAPDTTSDQVLRAIARDRARIAWRSRVEVAGRLPAASASTSR